MISDNSEIVNNDSFFIRKGAFHLNVKKIFCLWFGEGGGGKGVMLGDKCGCIEFTHFP